MSVPVKKTTSKKIIVIVTDCNDIAANEIRASILSQFDNPDEIILEPVVNVREFSQIHCNFSLRLMAEAYPEGTIFACIFNPMKDRPKSLIGITSEKKQIFMGRNTGAFDWITRDYGCEVLYDASDLFSNLNKEFLSFSGKLVTAPTIAKIAKGESIDQFGPRINQSEIMRLDIPDFTVVHIDNFGMIKFTGSLENPILGKQYKVTVNDHEINAVYNPRMMSEETGTWALFPGSSFGLFELGQARAYGAIPLDIKIGDKLQISE